MAFLLAGLPLAIVELALLPDVPALSMDFAVMVFALISVAVLEALEPQSMPLILLPCSFIESAGLISNHTFPAASHERVKLPDIDRVLVLLHSEIIRNLDLFPVKILRMLRLVS